MSVGEKNAYFCTMCHGYIVTIDKADGVTPMFLACRVDGEPEKRPGKCIGTMESMMYPKEPWPERDGYGTKIPTEPTHAWVAPSESEKRQDPDHYGRGGLKLVKL